MTPDRTRWCELLVGLERVEVLDVVRHHDHLVVTIESSERIMGCSACGTRARLKDRDRVVNSNEAVELALDTPVDLSVVHARGPIRRPRSSPLSRITT